MRRWPILALVAVAATAASTTAFAPAQASAKEPATAQPGWRVWQVAGAAAPASYYSGITALGASDAWVAGGVATNAKQWPALTVKHWTGGSWSQLTLPSADARQWGGQVAVAASSAADALVIGPNFADTGSDALRWNGHQWSASSLGATVLNDAIFSPADAWAFGSGKDSAPYAAHYNGRSWTRTSIPVLADQTDAVSPVGAGDIWAVGVSAATVSKAPGAQVTEAAHYDGKSWQAVPITNLRLPAGDTLYQPRVLALSAANVWVYSWVQGFLPGAGIVPLPDVVLTHWNGKTWSRVTVPYSTSQPGPVASDGHGGVWLSVSGKNGAPYLYHYNDGKWTLSAVPAVKGYSAAVFGLASIHGTASMWAVGELASTADNQDSKAVIWKYGA